MMFTETDARKGRMSAKLAMAVGVIGYLVVQIWPDLVGGQSDTILGFFSGLFGGGLATLFFTLRPRKTKPSQVDKDRMQRTAPWLYLVACFGLMSVLAGMALDEFQPGSALVYALYAAGVIPILAIIFPLINLSRAALTDPSLQDERMDSVVNASFKAGFNAMFVACMLGGAAAVVFNVSLSSAKCFYAIALLGGLAQMAHFLRDTWGDRK